MQAPDPETRAKLAVSIDAKAREMSELISNVLDLMSFEVGEVQLHREPHDLKDLVDQALVRLEGQCGGHPVTYALPADLPAIYMDAPLVTRVLVNLIENAVKHTPPGTSITVSAGIEGESMRIVVDDTGAGLPPNPERLFAKFQRGRDQPDVGGAGLGLAICRAIVHAHGGRIEADSSGRAAARDSCSGCRSRGRRPRPLRSRRPKRPRSRPPADR